MSYDTTSDAARLKQAWATIKNLEAELAASENRVKELEEENEWRGLLVNMRQAGWTLDPMDHGNPTMWNMDQYNSAISPFVVRQIAFPSHLTLDGLPSRPSDDVVAKIKEAVNG